VQSNINNLVINPVEQTVQGIRKDFWTGLNAVMDLNACKIYSYIHTEDDTFAHGKLWVINYFWFNKKGKKIAFLRASAQSKLTQMATSGMVEAHDADVSYDMDDGDHGDYHSEEDDNTTRDASETNEGYVDTNLLDWDELGMVEEGLPAKQWMEVKKTKRSTSSDSSAPPVDTGTFSLQHTVSPIIRPAGLSPVITPLLLGLSRSASGSSMAPITLPPSIDLDAKLPLPKKTTPPRKPPSPSPSPSSLSISKRSKVEADERI